ncbi:hypothetical protein AB205_0117930 [Aquarana catesbeiana]|uniref:Uncharacterized protein n=1 Tax=Aquarana catesbeiana TaxID=8400 RepID=A0A2G9SKG2_AQUCT|nr:hypothetical protein AB205_0117930 [Aquarana catesbeiana]
MVGNLKVHIVEIYVKYDVLFFTICLIFLCSILSCVSSTFCVSARLYSPFLFPQWYIQSF